MPLHLEGQRPQNSKHDQSLEFYTSLSYMRHITIAVANFLSLYYASAKLDTLVVVNDGKGKTSI